MLLMGEEKGGKHILRDCRFDANTLIISKLGGSFGDWSDPAYMLQPRNLPSLALSFFSKTMLFYCKTWLSFRYGTIPTDKIVEMAGGRGIKDLVLANINGTPDAWDFVDVCRQKEIHPVLGSEIRNKSEFCYLLLAKNDDGLLAINRFLSKYLQQKKSFPKRPSLGNSVWIIYSIKDYPDSDLQENERIGLDKSELNRYLSIKDKMAKKHFLIWQSVSFSNKTDFNIHRLLRAIDKNVLLSKQNSRDIGREEE